MMFVRRRHSAQVIVCHVVDVVMLHSMDDYVPSDQGGPYPPLSEFYAHANQGQYDSQGSGYQQQQPQSHQQQQPQQSFDNQEHFDSHGSGCQHPPYQQQQPQHKQPELPVDKVPARQLAAWLHNSQHQLNFEGTCALLSPFVAPPKMLAENEVYAMCGEQDMDWTRTLLQCKNRWKAVKAQFKEVSDFISSSGNKYYFRMTVEVKKQANMKPQLLLNSSALYDASWNGRRNSHTGDPTQHVWDSSSPEPDAAPEKSSGRRRKGLMASDAVVAAFNQNTTMLMDLERERMRAQRTMFKEEMEFTQELAKDANASIERSIGALAAAMRPPT
eukprot:jgi/Chlat1/3994/Chrsp26S04067